MSCRASRRPGPPAPSTAQVRSGQSAAHVTSLLAWTAQARTRSVPSGSSAGPIATAVCAALRGSIPIITVALGKLPDVFRGRGTAAACLIPDLRTSLLF
jgi:hypothetical protein